MFGIFKKLNKKGFSLIELMVSIAILSVLASLFVPSMHGFANMLKERTDKAAIGNLENAIKISAQNNLVYKDAKKIADDTSDNSITMFYRVNNDDVLVFDHCEAYDIDSGVITNNSPLAPGPDLADFTYDMNQFINGSVEEIEFISEAYKKYNTYTFKITFTDADFKVDVSMNAYNKN